MSQPRKEHPPSQMGGGAPFGCLKHVTTNLPTTVTLLQTELAMPFMPIEVTSKVASHLSMADLLSMALACQRYGDICQRVLFENVSFHGENGLMRLRRLISTLEKEKDLCSLVHNILLTCGDNLHDMFLFDMFSTISEVLGLLSGLQSISVGCSSWHSRVYEEFRTTLLVRLPKGCDMVTFHVCATFVFRGTISETFELSIRMPIAQRRMA